MNKETSFCYLLSQYQDVLQQEQQALIISLDFPVRLTSIIRGSQYGSLGYEKQFSFARRVLAVGGEV